VINKVLFIGVLFLAGYYSSGAQERKFIVNNVVTINPGVLQDSDLNFIEKIVKDKRIILLGEETHFDGAALLAKQRLIKYLYHLGFHNLCLEYNFFETEKAFQEIIDKKDSAIGALAYLTDRFPDIVSEEMEALSKTMDQSKGKLKIFGLDVIPGSIYFNAFYSEFEEYVKRFIDYDKSKIKSCFEEFALKGFHSPKKMDKIISDTQKLRNVVTYGEKLVKELELLSKTIEKASDLHQMSFFIQQIRSHISYYEYLIESKKYVDNSDNKFYKIYMPNQIRDKQMAENFFWIFKNADSTAKFIISLSSFHVGRNYKNISPPPAEINDSYKTFGDHVYWNFPKISYSIAFISYGGFRGHPLSDQQSQKFLKPDSSLESKLHRDLYEYAFIDMTNEYNHLAGDQKLLMQPTFEKAYRNKWSDAFDGLFYIDQMKPVKIRYMLDRSRKDQPYKMPKGW